MLSIAKDMAEDSNESGTGGSACVGLSVRAAASDTGPGSSDAGLSVGAAALDA